jgi:hypothetical protein
MEFLCTLYTSYTWRIFRTQINFANVNVIMFSSLYCNITCFKEVMNCIMWATVEINIKTAFNWKLTVVILCFVDCASLYNLVNRANLVHTDCLVIQGRMKLPCIPDRHPYSVTNARCLIDTVYFSWWWAHSCPKYIENKINILRKIVHQVGSIHKITAVSLLNTLWQLPSFLCTSPRIRLLCFTLTTHLSMVKLLT